MTRLMVVKFESFPPASRGQSILFLVNITFLAAFHLWCWLLRGNQLGMEQQRGGKLIYNCEIITSPSSSSVVTGWVLRSFVPGLL